MVTLLFFGILGGLLNVWAGGSLWPSQYLKGFWTNLPEIGVASLIAYGSFLLFGPWGLLGIVSYFPVQSSTWILLPWRTVGVRPLDRGATLRPISDFIADKFDIEFDTVQYAAIYGAIKGFLISLPIGGLGALYLPLAYELGQRLSESKKTKYAEVFLGVFIGINVGIIKLLT